MAPTTDGGAVVIADQKLLKFKGANEEAPLEAGRALTLTLTR